MKFTLWKDKDIAYSIEGKGQAVVFVHGFCEDSTLWEDFKQDLLEEHYRVVCIDLPGFGKSSVVPDISIEDMANCIKTVLDHINLDNYVLIGHSMGGYVGLAFANKYPERLLGLGLFHSHPYADSEEKKEVRENSIGFIKRQGHVLFVKQMIPQLFVDKFTRSNAFLLDKLVYRASKYKAEGIIAAQQAMMNRPDRSDVLRDMKAPVLFIIGKEDSTMSEEQSIEQTHLPDRASINILENVSHMGMFESRKKTQMMVREFVVLCEHEPKV